MKGRYGLHVRGERGVTLIEILAAVVILSMLAGMAGFSLSRLKRGVGLDDVAKQITQYDAISRLIAKRFNKPCRLRFNFDQINQLPIDDEIEDQTVRGPLELPAGYELETFWIGDEETSGDEEIVISKSGRSRTYALHLGHEHNPNQRWIIICGLTGRSMIVKDEYEALDILDILTQSRFDAD